MPDGSHGELITRAFSTLTLKSIDEEQRIIEGIASTPNSDRKGDVVWPRGAKFKLPLPFLMQHAATPNESVGHVIAATVTDEGIRINSNLFTSAFYTLTGFHGLHVVVGLIALIVLGVMAWARDFAGGRRRVVVDTVSIYWHFVDAVWVVIFSLVYLLGLVA